MAKLPRRQASQYVDRYIGNRIRTIREERGFKQVALARAIGVDPNTQGRYESGTYGVPLYILWKIADVLQAPIEIFFEGLPRDRETRDVMADVRQLDLHAARMLTVFPKLPLDSRRTLVAFLGTLVENGAPGDEGGEAPPGG